MSAENPRPAGVPDRSALQTSMREAAQKAQELQRQAEAARTSLNEAAVKVQELERQAASAQKTITLYQEQEDVIARALQDAQRSGDELVRATKARAEETIAAAKSAAESVVQSARTAAAETLQKAREAAGAQIQAAERTTAAAKIAADEIVKTARASAAETLQKAREATQGQIQAAERTTAAARTAADEIVKTARASAAETFQKAREAAQEQMQAAERSAAEHLGRLRAESDELVEETNQKVQEIRHAAEQYLTSITAKLDAFIRDREDVTRGLEALARNQAESLQIMTRLRSEVQNQILPAVHRLVRKLKGEDAGDEDTTPIPASTAAPQGTERPAPSTEPGPASPPVAPEATAAEAEEVQAPAVRYNGEIVVSPIHSFLQATKFMTVLSQLKGVASVKLRTYSGAKATIEVITEGHTVAGINYKAIDGFPIEVVESTDNHLVLRIGSPAARPVPG